MPRGKSSGSELASGYISLTVKYSSALSQVNSDFDQLEAKAATSGKKAGETAGKNLTSGVESGMKGLGAKTAFELDTAGIDITNRANVIGAKVGKVLADGITAPIRGIKSLFGTTVDGMGDAAERVHGRVGKSFSSIAEESVSSIGTISPAAGEAVTAIGAIAPEAGIAAVAVGGIAIAVGSLLEVGSSWDTMSSNMSRQTGLMGTDLKGVMDIVANEGKDLPLPFEKLSDATADVIKNLKLTGPQLQTVSEQVAQAAQNGNPVDVEKLGTVSRAMGMNGDQDAALLDQLNAESQKSGTPINAMLDALSRGAPLLKQFGLSAQDSAGLLGQFDAAGVDVNKVIPGMNTAFQNAAKAGVPFKTFLDDTIKKMQDLHDKGDEVGENKLAVATFGSRGAAAFVQGVDSGNVKPDELAEPVKPGGGIVPQASARRSAIRPRGLKTRSRRC